MPGSRKSPNAWPSRRWISTGLVAFGRVERRIDFVVIAPDNPLVGGLWDRLEAAGIRATGPSAAGAILEGSKGFVKDLCRDAAASPPPPIASFRDAAGAKAFANTLGSPVVIKADGLALGKGVIVAETKADAAEGDRLHVRRRGFGESGSEVVVVEEFMAGEEASFFRAQRRRARRPAGRRAGPQARL